MTEQTSRLAIIIDSTGAQRNAEGLAGALHGLTDWGVKAAASAGKVGKATEEEAQALSLLLDKIDPVNAALNKLDERQKQLAKFRSKNMVDDETFASYSKKIEETRNRLTGFNDQLNKTGMTAKQTAWAMRMVPAQMTDIVVSLAAGQAPLTVLLQQGGQLKDMFGGIAPAAKALGGYVMGLINPFTVAAGAVGILTYAVYENRKAIEAATKIAESSLGASGDSAERLALNMVAISDKTGQAINDVANMFITTKDGASEATNKLLDVGFSYDEARQKVAQYKDSANLTALNTDIEQHRLKILKIGNSWTDAAIKVKNYYTAADKGKQSVALGGAIDPAMRFIGQAIDLQGTMNTLTIEGNKAVAASVDWINKEYLAADRVAGAEARLGEARIQARRIASSGDSEAIANANKLIVAREKELEQAKKQGEAKPKKGGVGRAYTEDAATRLLDQINQQTSALNSQLATSDKLSSVTQQRVKFEQQIADLKEKKQLTADQKSLLARADEITHAYKVQEALQSQVTTLDDYRKMQEQVRGSEQKQNDLLTERLKLLDKAKAAGATDTEKTRSDIFKNASTQLPSSVQQSIGSLTPTGGQLSGSFEGLSLQYNQLDKSQQDLDAWLKQKEDAYARAGEITTEGEAYMTKVRSDAAIADSAIEDQKNKIITTATQSAMDSVVDIARVGFGEKSAVYKVAFAADKAYAIAQSMISIQAGIAQAANNVFPYNLVAMASVAAATASIVSNISAVAGVGFQSGGYTGNGGVSSVAGVVHGKEYVFDAAATKKIGVSNLESIRKNGLDATLSKPGFGTGATNVSNSNANTVNQFTANLPPVTINGNPSDTTIQLVQQASRKGAEQGYQKMVNSLATGTGEAHKALTGGYNTSRRAK